MNTSHLHDKTLRNSSIFTRLFCIFFENHASWVKIFDICSEEDYGQVHKTMDDLVISGRLPITPKNIEIIVQTKALSPKTIINEYSADAALTLIGFHEDSVNYQ